MGRRVSLPMFCNDRRQRDIREIEDQISKVKAFLEAWENVPQNLQPKWYRDALAGHSIENRLQWIFFEHGNPKEWMFPLPETSMQVIFAADEAPITALPGSQSSAPVYIQQAQTMPSAGSSYIQQALNDQGAAPAAAAAAPWQSYTQSGSQSQEKTDPAASAWQKSPGWQLNLGMECTDPGPIKQLDSSYQSS
eukprot:3237935-Amphidinium_carterae.1